MATLALALLAGILSTLSPCTIPLLPIVLGSALTEHRFGPLALAGGLALSFVAIGLFIATIGFSAGIDQSIFRTVAASMLIAVGFVLMIPRLQAHIAVAAGPVGNWIQNRASGFSTSGLTGQFMVGLLLGAIWSPCVGPTLGAASLLAAQGKDLATVTLTMAVFGLGAALPLVVLGMLSREALLRWRSKLMSAGQTGKLMMGTVLILAGMLIISGFDKTFEKILVDASPDWLTAITTRF